MVRLCQVRFERIVKISIESLYRFPSLFAIDTFFKYWTANYETVNKKTNVMLKFKDWFSEKGSFCIANKQNCK
jgi:hypothetical protein